MLVTVPSVTPLCHSKYQCQHRSAQHNPSADRQVTNRPPSRDRAQQAGIPATVDDNTTWTGCPTTITLPMIGYQSERTCQTLKRKKKSFVWAIGQWHSVYFFLKHFLFFLWKKKGRCDRIAVFLVYFFFTSGTRVLTSLFFHGNGSSMAMRSVLSFSACKLFWLNKFSLNSSSVLLTNNFTTLTTRWHYFVTKKMTNHFLRIFRTVRYSRKLQTFPFRYGFTGNNLRGSVCKSGPVQPGSKNS